MNLNALYSTVDVLTYLGAICNKTSILNDKHNRLDTMKDLEINRMHRIIYGAIENLALSEDIQEVDEVSIGVFLSAYPDQHAYFEKNNGNELIIRIKELSRNTPYEKPLSIIRKLTLLRQYEKIGFSTKDIYDTSLIEPIEISEQREKFEDMTELSIRNFVKSKMDAIHENMSSESDDTQSFHAGDDILDLLQRCKEEPKWGYSFKSKLYNRVFRGMQGKKVMIRSASSGSGKTRMSVSEMCLVSASEMYSNKSNRWESNPRPASSLFITTELDKDEMQLIMLACISGIPEESIKDGIYSPEVEQRLLRASEVIKQSKMFIEYTTDFSRTDLEYMIEKHINRNDVGFVFFDYIQILPKFARECKQVFGYELREDQMLNLMVSSLKNIANKFDIFILSSTQLNRSHKTDEYPDATHLRGGQATIDKADFGVITMKVTRKDRDKLEQLMREGFEKCSMPTHGHHVFKNRGGKFTSIIIWVNMNLDNVEVEDCFVTTQDFEQVLVAPKEL